MNLSQRKVVAKPAKPVLNSFLLEKSRGFDLRSLTSGLALSP